MANMVRVGEKRVLGAHVLCDITHRLFCAFVVCVRALQLPAIDSDEFRHEFLVEYNDTLLVTYLSAITKGCNVRFCMRVCAL